MSDRSSSRDGKTGNASRARDGNPNSRATAGLHGWSENEMSPAGPDGISDPPVAEEPTPDLADERSLVGRGMGDVCPCGTGDDGSGVSWDCARPAPVSVGIALWVVAFFRTAESEAGGGRFGRKPPRDVAIVFTSSADEATAADSACVGPTASEVARRTNSSVQVNRRRAFSHSLGCAILALAQARRSVVRPDSAAQIRNTLPERAWGRLISARAGASVRGGGYATTALKVGDSEGNAPIKTSNALQTGAYPSCSLSLADENCRASSSRSEGNSRSGSADGDERGRGMCIPICHAQRTASAARDDRATGVPHQSRRQTSSCVMTCVAERSRLGGTRPRRARTIPPPAPSLAHARSVPAAGSGRQES